MNMTPLVKLIVDRINSITKAKYAILNCKDGLESYTCGRAVSFSINPIHETKIIFFNTREKGSFCALFGLKWSFVDYL